MNGPEKNLVQIDKVYNALKEAVDAGDVPATKEFKGYTAATLQAALQPSWDTRASIAKLDLERIKLCKLRDEADATSVTAVEDVMAGVIGDKDYGDDCALIKEMGRIPKSERKTGKTNKTKDDAKPAPG